MKTMHSRRLSRGVLAAMLLLAAVGLGAGTAQAVWNGQLYDPGATLDPECDPGVTNCDVRPPANSGVNTNITALAGLTTPLTTQQGGTGLSGTVPLGVMLVGNGTSALSQLAPGTSGQVLGLDSGGNPAWVNPAAGTAYSAGAGLTLTGTTFSVNESTAHTWAGLQTFSAGLSLGGSTYTNLAGTGLANAGGILQLDLAGLTVGTSADAGDRLVFYDSATGTPHTVSRANLLAGQQAQLVLPTSGTSATTSANSGLELSGASLALLRGCSTSQILKWTGSAWSCAADNDTTYTAGTGITITGGAIGLDTSAGLTWQGAQSFQGGLTVGGDTVTSLTGTGLGISGGALGLDPSTLGTTSSAGTGDQLLLYNPTTHTTTTITTSDLLAGVTGALNFRGTWNASTNTPNLTGACTSGSKGYYYVVATPGSTNLDGTSSWSFNDWVVCNGTAWERLQSSSAVASVFGRTGTVTAANGDYSAGQITSTPAGNLAATDVQSALSELDSEKYGSGDNATLGSLGSTSLSVATGADRHTVIATLASSDGSTGLYATNATPEGDITAARGALAVDSTAGKLYIKTTTSGNTGWSQFGAASGCTTSGCSFTGSSSTIANTTTDGALTLNSNGNGALTLDSGGNGAVNVGTSGTAQTTTVGSNAGTSALVLNAGSGNVTVNGNSVLTGNLNLGSSKFTVAASSGDTAIAGALTATGVASLNGGVTVASGLTVSGGSTLGGTTQITGAQVTAATAVANQTSDGALGTAAATVDAHSYFTVAQTTAGRTLTLPIPTSTAAGQIVYVSNTGSAAFTMHGQTIGAGQSSAFIWNGSAWTISGTATPASICTTTGCTFTGGASTIQTTSAAGLSLVTDTTGALSLDSGTTGAVSLGTGASAKTVTIGSTTGAASLVLRAGTGGLSASSAVTTATAHSFTADSVTTGTALALSANGLTSGNGLAVTSSSTAMTGNLGYLALTGNSASNTGNLLYLSSSGTSSLATGLKISIAGSGLGALIDGSLALPSVAYTSTGTQNNVAFSKSTSTVRLNPASTLTITGITAGSDGQLLTLWNASANTVTLANANTGSSAANRLATGSSTDVGMAAGATAILQYDATSTVWRLVSRPYTAASTLMATTSAAQTTNIAVNDPIKFDTVTSSSGTDIGLNTGTYTFTLKANHTYDLTGQVNTANFNVLNTNAYVNTAWYNTTSTATQIGQSCTTISITSTLLGSGGSPVCTAIFTPSVVHRAAAYQRRLRPGTAG